MTRHDLIIATIRTAVPGAVGYLIAQLIALIPPVAEWIVTVDGILAVSAPGTSVMVLLDAAAVTLVIAAYYWAARELGRRFPVLEAWLLGRAQVPTYTSAPAATEDRVVNVTLKADVGEYLATFKGLQTPGQDDDDDTPKHRA